ncbi:hypothetical protein E2320_001703, partial [Naja naja]
RIGIYNVVSHGKAVSANKKADDEFTCEADGFIPYQFFNCDKTELFWGKKCQVEPTSQKRRHYQTTN